MVTMTLPCCVWNVTRGEIIFCTTNSFTQDIKDDMSVYGTLQEEKFYGAVQATQEGLRYYKRRNERRKYFTHQIILHRRNFTAPSRQPRRASGITRGEMRGENILHNKLFYTGFFIDQLGDTRSKTVIKCFVN